MSHSISRFRIIRPCAIGVCALALVALATVSAADPVPKGKPTETLVGGLPLFAKWPKDQTPDAVLVFSGQTYGYIQPCGCSRPQTGGLERRAMFIDSLKAKGWPVAGVDLGDIHPEKSLVRDQGRLKYVAVMNSLREMGYVAVGVGKTDISADTMRLLADYALQKEQRPFTLGANAVGMNNGKVTPRLEWFPPPPGAKRPLIEEIEVAEVGKVSVGVAGVVGKSLAIEAREKKFDPMIDFAEVGPALKSAATALAKHPKKPTLNVLIYQGSSADAAKLAGNFPEFSVILCQADDPLPPLQPQELAGGNTRIVQVGTRGQHVGVLGAFKNANGTFTYHYQLVPLGEEFITPGSELEARTKNKVLPILEEYAKAVKDQIDLSKDYVRQPHPVQIQAASLTPPRKLTYVGSEACKGCHAAEYDKWKAAPHSHAMQTLETMAKRPSLRNFDGECVQCHSVGFHYQGGYLNDTKTTHLRDVGCENCHGPGSGHVEKPKDKDLLAFLSQWKQPNAAKLPDAAFMKKMADTPIQNRGQIAIAPAQQILLTRVEGMCMKCHDQDAEPNFDIYKSWPKIDHAGLAPKGGWPEVAPKAKP